MEYEFLSNLSEDKLKEIEALPTFSLDPRSKNLTGIKQGELTIIKPAFKEGRRIFWWSICSCGKIESLRSDSKKASCSTCAHIRAGETNKGNGMKDLTNKQFGRLTALYPLEERKNNRIMWHCKCECGKELDVAACSLLSENTKSCGCLKKDTSYFAINKNNLIGQKFGKLTVLEETTKREYGKIVWKCQCDCGNIVYLNTSRLNNNNDISCGCLKHSYGAQQIEAILKTNNINFKKEYSFIDLPKRFFDFAIFDNNNNLSRLIEFDGEQHFFATGGWNNKEHFQNNQQRDQEKNNYCKEHNITLVRIPYWEKINITLEMILGDQYLI